MAIKKQNLQLSLNQGINTKIDPKQLPFGSFNRVENVKFDKEGEFNKRHGYDEVKGIGIGSTNNEAIIGISNFENQLLWISKDQVYSYSSGADVWQTEGSYDAVVPESTIILQNGQEQTQLQTAYLSGYKVFGWLESGKYKISVIDHNTGSWLINNVEVPDITASGSISYIRMEIYKNFVWLFWTDGSRVLYYKKFHLLGYLNQELAFDSSPTANSAFGAETSIATLASDERFDVAASSISMIAGYFDNSASELRFAHWDLSETVTADIDAFGTTAVTPHDALDLHVDKFGKTVVVSANGSGVVKIAFLGAGASQLIAPTTIEDVPSAIGSAHSVRAVTAASIDGLSFKVFCLR